MAKRYFFLFRKQIALLVILIALVAVSSVSSGSVSIATSIAAGVIMMYLAIRYAVWLFKAPVKETEEGL